MKTKALNSCIIAAQVVMVKCRLSHDTLIMAEMILKSTLDKKVSISDNLSLQFASISNTQRGIQLHKIKRG